MNNSRSHLQSFINNSLGIRQEIQRFESVHPSIFAIFDLIELIPDTQIAQQIRDHLVCIEDSFVHSQEWTLSRSVTELRLGIVGSLGSGKSALVHRYLTGSYMQEDSSDGGRYKKEVIIDNQSYLLLIRDEGGPPEMQFAAWVDAIVYVFSLENEASYNSIYNYYVKMSHFRNGSDIPIILVGTQDAICERSPRIIDDARARKLANDLKKCSYYETCATYGLNVERVFQDACQKILQHRYTLQSMTPTNSRPTTPQGNRLGMSSYFGQNISSPTNSSLILNSNDRCMNNVSVSPSHSQISREFQQQEKMASLFSRNALSASSHHIPIRIESDPHNLSSQKWGTISHATSQQTLNAIENNNIPKFSSPNNNNQQQINLDNLHSFKDKDLLTPISTPTTTRKTRRRSNLFIPSSKKSEEKLKNSELGVGRSIPLKQGYLYKRSSKSLNKEWKKKYVTLCDDGRLTYHPSLHDYMDDVHGKEIPLQYVTVKVPGQKPRGSKSILSNTISTLKLGAQQINGLGENLSNLSLAKDKKNGTEKENKGGILSGFDMLKESITKPNTQTSGDEGLNPISNSNSQNFLTIDFNSSNSITNKQETQTPNVKKRHRRMKSSGLKNGENDETEVYDFFIVSLDNKQWHFEASSLEERDDWVSVIEHEIFKSLQGNETTKSKQQNPTEVISLQSIRDNVPGNDFCVDCNAANPEWASLNLGVLMCIECSGIHRNLGSHISKVRSLDLDDWPPGHISVMLMIGNKLANSIWEGCKKDRIKPNSKSQREEKEKWIRSKYEGKEFILPCYSNPPIGQQLIEAVIRKDIKTIILLLAYATPKDVNSTLSVTDLRTPLHLSCASGNLALSQLLIWFNADIHQVDQDGRTCLSYAMAAAAKNSPTSAVESANALVELLVNLGCVAETTQPILSTCTNAVPNKLEAIIGS